MSGPGPVEDFLQIGDFADGAIAELRHLKLEHMLDGAPVNKGLRGHGFTLSEVKSTLSPAVSRSAFGACQVERTGSTLRIMMTRRP